jgi:hypothetical protein
MTVVSLVIPSEALNQMVQGEARNLVFQRDRWVRNI